VTVFATGISNGAPITNPANVVRIGPNTIPNLAGSVAVEAHTQDGRTLQLVVEYAGGEGTLMGLDQVIAVLPPELAGAGNIDLTVIVGGQRSNSVTIAIQ
jgi:uncharacterized protein (TIGR03437 family)